MTVPSLDDYHEKKQNKVRPLSFNRKIPSDVSRFITKTTGDHQLDVRAAEGPLRG